MDSLKTFGELVGVMLATFALLGLVARFAWKWFVLPSLKAHFAPIADQLSETHHQVTTNGHVSSEPTLKDAVHSLQTEVRELKGETRRDLNGMRQDLHTAGQLYDRHLDWSSRHADEVWRELSRLGRSLRHTEDDDAGNPAGSHRKEEP